MTESIGKTQALDDLAQFDAIDGALEVGTVDSRPSQARVRVHRDEVFGHDKRSSHKEIVRKETGLLRFNLWRLEIFRQVPAVETIEEMARTLEFPMHEHVYDDETTPKLLNLPKRKSA